MELQTLKTYVLCPALLITATPVAGNEDIMQAYGDEDMVSLATGYRQPLDLAPAVATVITAKDIEKMGAATLDQVIETLAGVHLSTADGITSVTTIRGITSRVLVLVNNIPLAQGFTNVFSTPSNIQVNNIARIEVVRGPGSAVYGADAIAGVINVVTKTAKDINGTEIGARAGSFDTYDGWLLCGGTWGKTDVAINLSGRTTQGSDRVIESDAQTTIDALLGTNASLAPSAIKNNRDIIDASINLSRDRWALHAGYLEQVNSGVGIGISESLDPDGSLEYQLLYTDLIYDDHYSDDFDISSNISFVNSKTLAKDLHLFPPGAFGGMFPEGVRQDIALEESRGRGEFTGLYSGILEHLIRFGVGGSYMSFESAKDKRNYTVDGGMVIPTGVFSERGGIDDAPIFPDADRKVIFVYAQDEWLLASDWILTTGVRFDYYSDFGGTTNPRIALVWNTRHDFTTKLLYGRAFRPPSITELYSNGLLTGKGKRTLEPVTVDSVEISFNYRSLEFQSNINFFWYHENNLIQLVPSSSSPNGLEFDNMGSQEGVGMEWEFKWNITQKLSLKGNYAYQSRIDDESDGNVNIRFAPEHQTYIEGNYQYSPNWGLNVNALSVFNRVRPKNDPRPAIDDYSIVNITLHRKSIAKYYDASFSVRNLFDEDVRDPSGSAATLPFDIPLPGRNIYGQIRARF